MIYDITKEQRLAIAALKKAVKRVNNAGLKIIMHDGSVTIHFKSDYEKYEFDCGFNGMINEDGEQIQEIESFEGIEH